MHLADIFSAMPSRSRTHRSAGQRTLIAVLWMGVALSVLTAAGSGYGAFLLNRIDRVTVPLDAQGDDESADIAVVVPGGADDGVSLETFPPLGPAGPARNILIVGTDDSEGIDPDDPILTSREAQSLADVLMLLRVDPQLNRISLLSVPRDLWVPLDGVDYSLKINSAYAFQNDTDDERNTRLLNTFRDALDVPVNNMIVMNWAGFKGLVDLVDGVNVCFPRPARDVKTGLSIEAAGDQILNGSQALAFVRSREYAEQDANGLWSIDPTSDIGRIARQQEFLRLLVDQTAEVRDITQLHSIALKAIDNVTIDQSLTIEDMIDLSRRFASLQGDELRTLTLETFPIVGEFRGAQLEALDLTVSEQNELTLDIFRGFEPDQLLPKRVNLSLQGGSEDAVEDLNDMGFDPAAYRGSEFEDTTIVFGRDASLQALLVAGYIDGDIDFVADETLDDDQVLLVLHEDTSIRSDFELRDENLPTHTPLPTTTTDQVADQVTTTTEFSVCS